MSPILLHNENELKIVSKWSSIFTCFHKTVFLNRQILWYVCTKINVGQWASGYTCTTIGTGLLWLALAYLCLWISVILQFSFFQRWTALNKVHILWIHLQQICVNVKNNITMFQKGLSSGNPNVTVWRVLWKWLHLKAYKLSIVQGVERWIVCTSFKCKRFRTIWYTIVNLFLKHPALPLEVTLNRNYPR
jgi:hypothetical protein